MLEHVLSSDRRLDTVVVMSIPETTVYVDAILNIISDHEHDDIITGCIGNLAKEVISGTLPTNLVARTIEYMLLDDFRVFINISKPDDRINIKLCMDEIITIIKSKIPILVNNATSVLVTNETQPASYEKALIISNIMLDKSKIVHFKIFQMEVPDAQHNY